MDHPYKVLPAQAYWRRAVAEPEMADVDPVGKFPFKILPKNKVATAGSCFAQHIARHLRSGGYSYLNTEPGHPLLSDELKRDFSYGLFSARFGNIYTSRQLLQLFERAFGDFRPIDDLWTDGDRFIDPYRPTCQPDGFATLQEFRADRVRHFASVRRMFEELDVFIFTLGLTEGYVNAADGAAYPVCPGVAGGRFDVRQHRFVNERAADVVDNLNRFLTRLRRVNPACRVILTVSPVPLVATASGHHVMQSTVYSKSVLRVAAQEIVDTHAGVAYFPSYEIITGGFNKGAYFQPDLREVREAGVEHVMRLFFKHATNSSHRARAGAATPAPSAQRAMINRMKQATAVICDEALLDAPPRAA